MREGKQSVAKCYGRNQLSSSENRYTIWKNKTIVHRPYMAIPPFLSFFPNLPLLARLYQQYHPNGILDRYKNKLTWQS